MADRQAERPVGTPVPAHAAAPRGPAQPQVVVGFAIGAGIVFVATLGVYWNYWQPAASTWAWAGGSFAIGAVVGAAWAAFKRVRV